MRAKIKHGSPEKPDDGVTVVAQNAGRAHEWAFSDTVPQDSENAEADALAMPAPGDVICNKYRVERVLGQGGMGAVVAARHLELGELYAIKLMLPGLLGNAEAINRFLREARACARLKGDHVARVHDVVHGPGGMLFMIMEYLEGSDLKTLLAARGRLPIEEALDYVLQTCDALAEAHENEIVHRDIKPANLFLTRKHKTGAPLVKVLDFGISKQLNLDPHADLTKTGAMLGSPLYMSPEQMRHSRKVDIRTDIWSLGVVLYELTTGEVPFDGKTVTQVFYSVTTLEPKPIRPLVMDIPRAVEEVILRCLAKDPDKRFPNVKSLAQALKPILIGMRFEKM